MNSLDDYFCTDFSYHGPDEDDRNNNSYVKSICDLADDGSFHERYRLIHPNNSKRWSHACTSDSVFWETFFKTGDRLPTELEIHSSFRCLLKCWFCCSPNRYENSTLDSSRIFLRNVSNYLKQLTGILDTVQFSGGREPLMDPSLISLVSLAHHIGAQVRLNTSGVTTIDANRLPNIVTYFDYIAVSLDAPSIEVYQKIKQSKLPRAKYDQLLSDIQRANKTRRNSTKLELAVLILPENIGLLPDMCLIARNLGCSGVRFRKLKTGAQLGELTEDRISRFVTGTSDRLICNQLLDLQQQFDSADFGVFFNSEDFSVDYQGVVCDSSSGCMSCFRKVILTADGNVAPCASLSYPSEDGTITHSLLPEGKSIFDFTDFYDLWRATFIKRNALNKKACGTCYISDRYLNNMISNLQKDYELGVSLGNQFYAHLYQK